VGNLGAGLSVHPAMQRVVGEGKELLGTIAYTAPEVLQDASQLQMPSDVYAFGLLSEILVPCLFPFQYD
jgi:serine/threonine protein kinase